MKAIYLLLFVSLNAFANISVGENSQIVSSNVNTEDSITVTSNPNPKKNNIAGLKIITRDSKTYGKHIYIISDLYIKKKVSIYNETGKKVYSTSTVGSPIYLSKMEKGEYTIKIKEGSKTEIKDLVVN